MARKEIRRVGEENLTGGNATCSLHGSTLQRAGKRDLLARVLAGSCHALDREAGSQRVALRSRRLHAIEGPDGTTERIVVTDVIDN